MHSYCIPSHLGPQMFKRQSPACCTYPQMTRLLRLGLGLSHHNSSCLRVPKHDDNTKQKRNNTRRSQSSFVQATAMFVGCDLTRASKHSNPALSHFVGETLFTKRYIDASASATDAHLHLCHLISLASHFSFSLWNVFLEVSSSPLQPAFVHAAPG